MASRWAPLQVSAHILQNLLLWWKLGATLRGCAFFFHFLVFAPTRAQRTPKSPCCVKIVLVRRKTRSAQPLLWRRPWAPAARAADLRAAGAWRKRPDDSAILARLAGSMVAGNTGKRRNLLASPSTEICCKRFVAFMLIAVKAATSALG